MAVIAILCKDSLIIFNTRLSKQIRARLKEGEGGGGGGTSGPGALIVLETRVYPINSSEHSLSIT